MYFVLETGKLVNRYYALIGGGGWGDVKTVLQKGKIDYCRDHYRQLFIATSVMGASGMFHLMKSGH